MAELPVAITVNGEAVRAFVEPRETLADFVRDHCSLTGTHLACEHGVCGACTVLVDGKRVNSCFTLAIMTQGKPITTIEGLAKNGALHPMQAAFLGIL